jgi:hypothetical protein
MRCDWQNNQASLGYTNPRDAICPLGFALGAVPAVVAAKAQATKPQTVIHAPAVDNTKPAITVDKAATPPKITPKKVVSFMEAMLLSPRVTPEVEAARIAICDGCDKLANGRCSMCNCKVKAEGFQITNLAHYAENLPKWGCKHPLRGYTDPAGKKLGWPLQTSATPPAV